MLKYIADTTSSALQIMALIAVNIIVGGTIAVLMALTLLKHFEDTPEIRRLSCAIGIERADCPRYVENMKRLQSELDAIVTQRDNIEGQLAGLRAVETAIDEMTLFENLRDPVSGLEITIGTVYKEFVDAQPSPDSYFCYINLANGPAGESRNLHFQGKLGPLSISASKLEQVGVSADALGFGRSACKPFLIGQG